MTFLKVQEVDLFPIVKETGKTNTEQIKYAASPQTFLFLKPKKKLKNTVLKR